MRVVQLLVLVALLAGAFAAPKYALNAGRPVTATDQDDAQGPIGSVPEQALEWFRFQSTTSCYRLWTDVDTNCGRLPGATDDVVLGFGTGAGTGTAGEYTVAQSIYYSFNSPRVLCAAGGDTAGSGCVNFGTVATQARPDGTWNANISSLTFRARTTTLVSQTSPVYPIQFTGYPQTSGTYAPAATTWTVVGSTKLRTINGVFVNHPNVGIYGSGYGTSAGGVNAGADGATIGNRAFSAADVYGETDRAGARNALHNTAATAVSFEGVAANQNAWLAGYGFILETPLILIDGCQYGTAANTRCTGIAATEIQGPNLYIQPVDNIPASDASLVAPDNSFTRARVNVTVARKAALFTTATNYINVDFHIQYDGILAFCEPNRRDDRAATTSGAGEALTDTPVSNGFSQAPYVTANTGAFAASDKNGNSYLQRSHVTCSPVATAALDWFGTSFTSVRIFNADSRLDNVLYSEVLPNLAKLALRYGSAYTVPVLGNVTIEILAQNQLDTTELTPAAGAGTNSGRRTAAATGASPLGVAAAPDASGRGRAFVGMAIPYGLYTDAVNEIPYVQSFDCASVAHSAFGGENPEALTGVREAVCDGLHTPTRFTFFGGVATIQKLSTDASNTQRQLIALTQYDLLVAGDGNSARPSALVFGQLSTPGQGYQLCGHFAARSNGALRFVQEHAVLLSSKIALVGAGVRRFGQVFSQQAALDARSSAASPVALTATPAVVATASQTPVPRRTTTCSANRYTWVQTGSDCTLGTYSFLYTAPATGTDEPVVVQFNCNGGTCSSVSCDVPATTCYSNTLEYGCYAAAYTPPTDLVPTEVSSGTRGYCRAWSAPTVRTVGQAQDFANRLPPGPPTDPSVTVSSRCPVPTFSGLHTFPSSALSNATVGEVVFNSPVTVNDVNATFQSITALARSSFAVSAFVNVDAVNVPLAQTTPSTMLIGNLAVFRVDGASASLSSDPTSTVDVLQGGVVSVTGGSLGAGNFRVMGSVLIPASNTGTIGSASAATSFTGSGSLSFAGTSTVVGSVSSVVSNSTVSGALDVQGTYTHSAGDFTVAAGAVIGSTVATGSLVLSGSGNLRFAGSSSISAAGPVAHLTVTLASSSNQVIVAAGTQVTATVPLVITTAAGVTANQLVVNGALVLEAASTISANVAVAAAGQLFGNPSFVVNLAGNTTVAGTLGRASQRFQIGSSTRPGVLRLVGGRIGGAFLLQSASFVLNSGTSNISEATTVSTADGVTATTTTSATQYNAIALFNEAGAELLISAPFTSNVDIINAGTISVGANQVLTIQGGRTLRLRNGVVTGAGQVVVASGTPAGQIIVDSGNNNQLTPANLVNNAVITVASGAVLTVTSCVSGSGSITGTGAVVFTTSTGCLSNTGVSTLNNLQLNTGTSTTVGAGLTIITSQISGQGVIVANGGFIAINNNNGLSLAVTGNPQVGSATGAQDGVVISGTINTGASSLILGAATVARREIVAPYALITNGVTAVLNGNLVLAGALLVPAGATLTATGTISGTGALTVQGQLTVGTQLSITVPTVAVSGILVGSADNSVLNLGSTTVLSLATGAQVGRVSVVGGRVVAVGAFTFGQNVTINSQFDLTGSLVVPAGVTFRAQGVVVCNNGATITAQAGGRVVFETFYIGCVVSGDAFSGPGLPGNGTTIVNATLAGNLIIGAAGFTIPASTNLTVVAPTRVVCTATVCTVTVAGNLTIPFSFVCFDNLAATNPAVIAACPLGGIFSTGANVVITVTGTIRFVSGSVATITVQDVPTYPVGTFGSLVYGPTAHTIIQATGAQINPVIVLNTITLGGTLEVITQSFVPLRPTVIFRALNRGNAPRGVTGSFSSVVIHYDHARSAHPWAWNVGFPTVRVVNNDVVLDPNGNGSNGASAAAPSFVVALLAVVAAFFLRK